LASRARARRHQFKSAAAKHSAHGGQKEMDVVNTAEKRARERAKIESWMEEIEVDSLSPPKFVPNR
jgi:hypothetical protein